MLSLRFKPKTYLRVIPGSFELPNNCPDGMERSNVSIGPKAAVLDCDLDVRVKRKAKALPPLTSTSRRFLKQLRCRRRADLQPIEIQFGPITPCQG